MPKVTMNDMKFNSRKRETPKIKESYNYSYKKPIIEREEIIIPKKEEKIEHIQEEKINEYFKNKYSDRQKIRRTPHLKKDSNVFKKNIKIIFYFLVVFGLVYFIGNFFHKANITIIPKFQQITYENKQFIASKDLINGPIDFEITIRSDKKSKGIILSDSKEISVKAKGSITLFNEFSMNPQKLGAGTFIIDNDGKTYKIDNTVTIPGYKTNNGKIIPGQIITSITSFLPGESYNGKPKNFYVNSFKGTNKYSKIYGETQTPLSGGIAGEVYVLNDANKKTLDDIANTTFKDDLFKKVKTEIPSGYILYPNALTFSYKIDDNFSSKTPEAEVPIEGTLSVILIKEKGLIDNIIEMSLPNITKEELVGLKILDLDKLTFNFTNKDQIIEKDTNTIPFTLTGKVGALWSPDVDSIKSKLKGIHKDNVLPIFKEDKTIASAIVKISPPWKKYIPEDLRKINILIK